MNNLRIRLLFLLTTILLSIASGADGQWMPTNGPTGPQINAVGSSGGNFFAGSDVDGFFRSTDLGLSWIKDSSRLFGYSDLLVQVNCIANLGNEVFASSSRGIFGSNDNGITWYDATGGGFLQYQASRSITSLGDDLFVIVESRICRSTDSGNSWTWVSQPIENIPIGEITVLGNALFAYSDSGLYSTTNSGDNWFRVIPPNSPWSLF